MARRKRDPLFDFPQGAVDDAMSMALAKPTVVFKTLLKYDENGTPHVVGAPIRTDSDPKEAIFALMNAFLDCPYDGKDKSLEGMTMREAMVLQRVRDAANGNPDAFDSLLDRLVGEPLKRQQNVTLTGDLGTFLDKVASSTRTTIVDVSIPPAEVRNPEDDL